MSDVERKFFKTVDEEILNATPTNLKKLQKLDIKTQLDELTFYDAYAKLHREGKKETPQNNPHVFRKSNRY